MSISGFQLALCEATASPDIARQLRTEPDVVLRRYDLTMKEQRRLMAVARQPGMATCCAIYRLNRITPLCLYLPMTTVLLGDDLIAEADLFWSANATDLQYQPEANRFGSFLRARIADGRLTHPFLEQVLEFELAVNDVQFAVPSARRPDQAIAAERDADRRRWAHPCVRVSRFDHEPLALLAALGEGRIPRDANPGESYLLIDGRERGLRIVPMAVELGRRLQTWQEAVVSATLATDEDEILDAAGLLIGRRSS